MKHVKCLHCENVVAVENARPNIKTIKGVGYVCEDCIKDSMDFFICDSCGEVAEFGECNSANGGCTYGDSAGTYCSECAIEVYRDYILESEQDLVKDFESWLLEEEITLPTIEDLTTYLTNYAYTEDKELFEANINLVKEILHKNFKITNENQECDNQLEIPF